MLPSHKSLKSPELSPIQDLVAILVDELEPVAIWLFGSRVSGTNNDRSDWDLLAIVSDESDIDEYTFPACEARRLSGVNVDLIICTASEFSAGAAIPNTLAYEIRTTGVPIYEHRAVHR